MKASGHLSRVLDFNPADSLVAGRVMARALAEECDPEIRLAFARSFGAALVEGWWRQIDAANGKQRVVRPFLQPFALVVMPQSALALAESLACSLAEIDVAEAAHFIGQTYTAMLPADHRGKFGVFYTPPALSERLIDLAETAGIDWKTAHILDPACGGGAFLAPIARRVVAELAGCEPELVARNVAARLRGYEIDPFAAWLSQITLDAVMLPMTARIAYPMPASVIVRDSLKDQPSVGHFDLVIGNPPYGRVRLSSAEREPFKRSLFGHANLYGLFTELALRHAKPDGVIAYLTPTSFLAGEYFKNLRSLLASSAPPTQLDIVVSRKGVFDDVLQETALATYCRGRRPTSINVSTVDVLANGSLDIRGLGSTGLPDDVTQPWLLPRLVSQTSLVEVLKRMPHRLQDWGYGVSTGPLVWNRKKSQLAFEPGRNRLPLLWAEAVTPDGSFSWRAEKKNHAPFFEVGPDDRWLVTDKPCVLLQRTTAKEQLRRLIAAPLRREFIEEHGSVVVENHLNMIRPVVELPAVSADVLSVFLNSAAADRAFRCVSGSVAVSAYELQSLPIPAPEDLHELARLVRVGAGRLALETVCDQFYERSGVTP